ncbi:hypothetical protein [Neomoorella thermoacetica]|uniref:hypothetical protein n=1 Tax=Neomoorella thermoacetica TaxID=1525 RepID=UPI0030CCBE7B
MLGLINFLKTPPQPDTTKEIPLQPHSEDHVVPQKMRTKKHAFLKKKPSLAETLGILHLIFLKNIEFIEGLSENKSRKFWLKGKVICKDGEQYLAFPSCTLRNAFEKKGLDYKGATNALKQAGLLLASEDGRHNAIRLRFKGTPEWCLAIRVKAVLGNGWQSKVNATKDGGQH